MVVLHLRQHNFLRPPKKKMGWDGRVGGNIAAAGTYAWYCSYQMPASPVQSQKGTVILIR